jgi:hypothetical protein
MPSQFELREVGTLRLLGTVEMVDVLHPGAVVHMFRDNLVLVEHRAGVDRVAAVPAGDSAEPSKPSKKGRRAP